MQSDEGKGMTKTPADPAALSRRNLFFFFRWTPALCDFLSYLRHGSFHFRGSLLGRRHRFLRRLFFSCFHRRFCHWLGGFLRGRFHDWLAFARRRGSFSDGRCLGRHNFRGDFFAAAGFLAGAAGISEAMAASRISRYFDIIMVRSRPFLTIFFSEAISFFIHS